MLAEAYIYALDHWRVLRVVPASTFASMQIDWWCQANDHVGDVLERQSCRMAS